MDAGLREGGGTAYCEHLLPRKAGRSVPFHGIVSDAQPYGLAQEWRGSNAVAALHLQEGYYEDEIRSVEGPDARAAAPWTKTGLRAGWEPMRFVAFDNAPLLTLAEPLIGIVPCPSPGGALLGTLRIHRIASPQHSIRTVQCGIKDTRTS